MVDLIIVAFFVLVGYAAGFAIVHGTGVVRVAALVFIAAVLLALSFSPTIDLLGALGK